MGTLHGRGARRRARSGGQARYRASSWDFSVLFEHASAVATQNAAAPFPFAWDAGAPDVTHDVLGRVGIEVMRGRERPAQPDFMANELVNENPPTQTIGKRVINCDRAGEALDLACPCTA